MVKYRNLNGRSGIVSYETGKDYIRIRFRSSGRVYTYSEHTAGATHVRRMKMFARCGFGLNSYVSRYVRTLYER